MRLDEHIHHTERRKKASFLGRPLPEQVAVYGVDIRFIERHIVLAQIAERFETCLLYTSRYLG